MLRNLVSGLALAAALPCSLGLALTKGPRVFDLSITWEKHAPNGVSRDMILVNKQFPGPLIEVNEGDEVWVNVHNHMPFNTTMHYHGIEMSQTPWSDGVPGITQREIPPGGSFLYKWTATQYGEYWYHAHHRGQIDDGQLGPLIIHPKKNRATPFGLISKDRDTLLAISKAVAEVKPLVLSDWRNIPSAESWDIEAASKLEIPCYDSLLINGRGTVNCRSASEIVSLLTPAQKMLLQIGGATAMTPKACLPKEVQAKVIAGGRPVNLSAIPAEIFDICTPSKGSNTVIEVKKSSCDKGGTWVAFDVIGAYSTLTATFSIDGLPLWVYAIDGEYIEPQHVNAISVTNGDRYSFLVNLLEAGDYTIRHANTLAVQIISGQATLSYRNTGRLIKTPTQYISDSGLPLSPDVVFYNQTLQKSYPASPVGQKADQTFILEMGNTDAAYKWSLNGTSDPLTTEDGNPVLFSPQPGLVNNLTITTRNNTWIDLIFVTAQFPQPPHPIHKHGNKMWLIGSGNGPFKWSSVEEAIKEIPKSFNLVDPPRRDGFATLDAPRGPTWTAVRYHVTNPGAWLLHCHIQTHQMGGMSIVIQDGIDHWPKTPKEYLAYGVEAPTGHCG
ncbi:multicopper oxidase [Trichoderma barbatum]